MVSNQKLLIIETNNLKFAIRLLRWQIHCQTLSERFASGTHFSSQSVFLNCSISAFIPILYAQRTHFGASFGRMHTEMPDFHGLASHTTSVHGLFTIGITAIDAMSRGVGPKLIIGNRDIAKSAVT